MTTFSQNKRAQLFIFLILYASLQSRAIPSLAAFHKNIIILAIVRILGALVFV